LTHHSNIAVGPVEGGGWSVAWDGVGQPMLFLSGARAEAHARALALRLCDAGEDVDLTVRDRARVLVGSARYRAGTFA
jgi:hypothetical protein